MRVKDKVIRYWLIFLALTMVIDRYILNDRFTFEVGVLLIVTSLIFVIIRIVKKIKNI